MAETFHRRGHHIQRAHGRRGEFAADGSHLSGGMIALMPTAADAKRLAFPGGEKAADLHCTLLFLGDDGSVWTEEQRSALEDAVRRLVAGVPPVNAKIFGVAHWNGDGEQPSWVWSVGDSPDNGLADADLAEARALAATAATMTMDLPEIPQQHTPWVAHICAAYSGDLTVVRSLEKRLGPVTFDRIRLSFGDDDRDIPLSGTAVSLTAAGLRRDPHEHEMHVDYTGHTAQWTEAVRTAAGRLSAEMADWRGQIHKQILAGADTPEELAGLTVETTEAADILSAVMHTLAKSAGDALVKEAQKQGVKVPDWSLPDDTVTAAVGGQRLLRSVAQMTSDLLATNMVQSARRFVTGLLSRDTTPEALASAVDERLQEGQEQAVQGPIGTAMSAAQTAGREAVLRAAPPGSYYSSEILDGNTCGPCKEVDGEQFDSLEIAIKAYPVMGYKDCVGPKYGNSCRGMIVANWRTSSVETASAAILRPDTAMIGEGTVPWHTVHNHSECPDGKPWAVVKDSDGSVAGCHDTQAGADKQLAALYANSPEASVTTEALKKGEPNPGTDKDKRLKENKKAKAGASEGETETLAQSAGGEAPTGDGKPFAGATRPWRGPLTVEGIETGDGREFDSGALTWADLPLPLRWNRVDSHGGETRTEAVNVGNITKIWREDSGLIMGEGLLDLGDEDGRNVERKIEGSFLRGVSVDVDSIKDADMELVWPETPEGSGEGEDPFAQLFASPEKVVFHKGRIRAATLVDIPAFAEAYIALLDEAGAVVAGGTPIGSLRESRPVRHRTLGVQEIPARPPRDWFTNPDLSVPTGITVSPEGRVYGHAALWGTCHVGQAGLCVTPPQEDDHPYFMTGAVWTEEGDMISVGQITLGTGHADIAAGHRAATEHYDNTGTAVADVAVGNDAHGIWVAGSVRPGTPADKIHELRASGQVSGDWRNIGGHLRLVGLLAVNVPGFPVPKIRAKYTSGHQFALVAAGIPQLTEGMSEEDLDQWAYARIMSKLGSRVHRKD